MILHQLPYCVADGPWQMAADEVMLRAAANGLASFRLYAWSEPTVSLGYFQAHETGRRDLMRLPWVRRCTGGLTLVHHHELTYALALPAAHVPQPPSHWLERIHQIIAAALATTGVATEAAGATSTPMKSTALCFHHATLGDLLIGPTKVVGSAQRRQRGALLQHGAILLGTSPHTPSLAGIQTLTGRPLASDEFGNRFGVELTAALGWNIVASDWTATERQEIGRLATEKYRSRRWNEKR